MEKANRRFIQYMILEKGCSENTILAYRADLEQFRQVLAVSRGDSPAPALITGEALSGYEAWLLKQGYQPATISRKMAAVRSFLDYLITHEGFERVELLNQLRSPPSPRRQPRILSPQEVARLLEAPSKADSPRGLRDFAILTMLNATGLRAAEVVNLQLEDVDLGRGRVLRPSDRDHAIHLNLSVEPLNRYLKDGRPHLVRNPQERAFFLNQRGKQLSRQGLWLVVKRWTAKAGLSGDISPHTLRHTVAHNLLNQGKSRKEVQQFLGLSSPNAIIVRRGSPSD